MFVLTAEMKCGNAPARTVFRCAVRVSLQPLRFCEIHEFEKETDMIVPARWDTDNFYILQAEINHRFYDELRE